jgi:hypothetical protein
VDATSGPSEILRESMQKRNTLVEDGGVSFRIFVKLLCIGQQHHAIITEFRSGHYGRRQC